MKRHKLAALLVTTYIGFITTAHASAPQPVFSPEQEARIGEIAADYLVSHPEIRGLRANDVKNHVNRLTYCFILIIRCCIYSYSNDHGADGRWNAIPSRLIA